VTGFAEIANDRAMVCYFGATFMFGTKDKGLEVIRHAQAAGKKSVCVCHGDEERQVVYAVFLEPSEGIMVRLKEALQKNAIADFLTRFHADYSLQ